MKFKKFYIEITNICNKNCSFCLKSNRKKTEMSIENFAKVLDEVKEYTDYIYLHVKGEPLLHSNFASIINLCDAKNIHVNITTNGTLLSRHKEIIINSTSIRQINISLHSFTKKDDFKDLFEAVDEINKHTNIYLVYRYWIMNKKTNIKENLAITNLVDHYHFEDTIIEKIYEEKNIKLNETLYINKDEEFTWPSLTNKSYSDKGTCYGLKTHIGILSDGTVVPCCLDGEGIIKLGNIFQTSLNDILTSERATNIIKNFKCNKKIEELCKHCNFKK